ncbi:hypothetical protein Tco_1329167 [Tanacetum coccineum]
MSAITCRNNSSFGYLELRLFKNILMGDFAQGSGICGIKVSIGKGLLLGESELGHNLFSVRQFLRLDLKLLSDSFSCICSDTDRKIIHQVKRDEYGDVLKNSRHGLIANRISSQEKVPYRFDVVLIDVQSIIVDGSRQFIAGKLAKSISVAKAEDMHVDCCASNPHGGLRSLL